MLIINADDLGRNQLATDKIMSCYKQGSITSASGMVFMEDSERAAALARSAGIDMGLHLNFSQKFTGKSVPSLLSEHQERIVRFLTSNRYALLLYHPALRNQFHYVFRAQLEEFFRLYGSAPSHYDGHHHMHLCTNVLVDGLIPRGQKVRRNSSFTAGEKSILNRGYRAVIDRWLTRRYRSTDFLFSMRSCIQSDGFGRVTELAKESVVELETHPENADEYDCLMGEAYAEMIARLSKGTYASL